MTLDLGAALRQTTATSYSQDEVDRLLAGRLRMQPHPEWQLPEEPTWREDPFEDRNWRFQFHMLRWLEPLRRAASKGNDAAYRMWLRWVLDWVEKNPPSAPRTDWAWTDMSDGIRVQQLCSAAPMIADRAPELLPWLESTIRVHADHLADPANMGNANHALHQQESLFVCGRVLQDEELERLASSRMSALLKEQYDEQGMNAEGATAYHYNNYLWWERALGRFDLEGIHRPDGADRHLHAPEEIAHATKPDGLLVPIGDTDEQSPKLIQSPFVEYVTTGGRSGSAPRDTAKVYDAGYVFARSGWGDTRRSYADQTFYTLRFGPARRVHGHPDGTSLTYSSHGVNWLTDLGKYQYGRSVPRDHFASREGHSVLSIDGRAAFNDAYVELVDHSLFSLAHQFFLEDNSYNGVEITRRVIYSTRGEYLVIIDKARSRRRLVASQRWQLGPDVDATIDDHEVNLTAADRHATLWFDDTITGIRSVRAQDDPFDGYVSTGWKRMTPATAVIATCEGTSVEFLTVLGAGTVTAPSVTTVAVPKPGCRALDIDFGSSIERILISPTAVSFPRVHHATR
ncbi:heparinase II/III family protein [Brachybacterium squillarum]|uniref:heparinase II/III family protein n=1 Tax=Brachybacterium squillarum TaxID=661979 RepID=UPI002221B4F8|nr:heparinase II/III family protein [Brachybacterium squillarum]MCW1805167.1 heparinase II/III family protein [Brachybacterium squillarum]